MLGGLLFGLGRCGELLLLIPIVGVLGYLVHGLTTNYFLPPSSILTLFIVSVLATTWALITLLRMSSTRRSARLVALVDLGFVGALIAGVYNLRGISHCESGSFYLSLGIFGLIGKNEGSPYYNIQKTCAMLKAAFALGILSILAFSVTFLLALLLHRHEGREKVVEERRSHVSRRGSGRHRDQRSRR